MLIGQTCEANTFPYIEVMNATARVEHEATTSKISEEQLFYLAAARHLAGRCSVVDYQRFLQRSFQELPMEYAVEAQKLLGLNWKEASVNGNFIEFTRLGGRVFVALGLRARLFQKTRSRFANLSVVKCYGERFAARQHDLLRRLSIEFRQRSLDSDCFFRNFDD
jgi:hypothetical protein